MSTHVVKPGECLASIAAGCGVTWRQLWDDPANAPLRERRKDPNVLHPGDEVALPEAGPPRAPLTLDEVTTVVRRRRGHRPITLRALDPDGAPLRDADFTLTPDGGDDLRGRTDADGVVRAELPVDAVSATLVVGEHRFPLAVGHLNPLDETDDEGVTGAQARLLNLGYRPGPIDGELGRLTRAALRAFQTDEGLEVTGALDAPTKARLRARHGR